MTTFDELISRSAVHSDREAGLPGRPDPVDRVPCAGCARAVARWSMTWRGACGTPVVRYGCTGDPGACPYRAGEYRAGEQGGESA